MFSVSLFLFFTYKLFFMLRNFVLHVLDLIFIKIILLPKEPHKFFFLKLVIFLLLSFEFFPQPKQFLLNQCSIFVKNIQPMFHLMIKIVFVIVNYRYKIIVRFLLELLNLSLKMCVSFVNFICDLRDHLSKITLYTCLNCIWRCHLYKLLKLI